MSLIRRSKEIGTKSFRVKVAKDQNTIMMSSWIMQQLKKLLFKHMIIDVLPAILITTIWFDKMDIRDTILEWFVSLLAKNLRIT